jgi:hypothetical protein
LSVEEAGGDIKEVKIVEIIWLEEIVDKLLRKHAIQPFEVKEVFTNSPIFRLVEKGHRKGENLYAALNQTNAGRYLIIFFVYKKNQKALIISARDMNDAERTTYQRS